MRLGFGGRPDSKKAARRIACGLLIDANRANLVIRNTPLGDSRVDKLSHLVDFRKVAMFQCVDYNSPMPLVVRTIRCYRICRPNKTESRTTVEQKAKNEFMAIRDPGSVIRGMLDELRILEAGGKSLQLGRTAMLKLCVERCLSAKKHEKSKG